MPTSLKFIYFMINWTLINLNYSLQITGTWNQMKLLPIMFALSGLVGAYIRIENVQYNVDDHKICKSGQTATVAYTGYFENGIVFETSKEWEDFSFVIDSG